MTSNAPFWQEFWNGKGTRPSDFDATGRSGMDVVGFLFTVREASLILGLSPDHEVLDVGCGTGLIALAISPFVRRVHGVDIAETMVERARVNLRGINNASLSVATITALDQPDSCYDRLLAYSVLQYLDDETAMRQALSEVHRVLRPGGMALLAANPDPARYDLLTKAIDAKSDATMRTTEHNLLGKTLWLAPERLVVLAEEVGLSAKALAINSRIWQHFYMYDLVVYRNG